MSTPLSDPAAALKALQSSPMQREQTGSLTNMVGGTLLGAGGKQRDESLTVGDLHFSIQSYTNANLETEQLDKLSDYNETTDYEGERKKGILAFLCKVPHLYFLPYGELQLLASCVLRREYNAFDTIQDLGSEMTHIGIVLTGSVEVFQKAETGGLQRVGTIPMSNIFNFETIILGNCSKFLFKAGDARTSIGMIPMSSFASVMERNVKLRQSIGRKIAADMDIFGCFKEFSRHLFSHETAQHEYLPLWSLVESYTAMNNSIHNRLNSHELDVGAWGYAIGRLPENVTSTFSFDLVRALPPFVASRMQNVAKTGTMQRNNLDNGDIKYVNTKLRRRCSWELGVVGKTLVLLRDGFTDLIDFVTCLCAHILEANKLRARLQGMVHPPAIDILDEQLNATDEVTCPNVDEVLKRMPFSPTERRGLRRMWPGKECLKKLWEVIMHREEYMLRVDASVSRRFQIDPFHQWGLNKTNSCSSGLARTKPNS